MSTLKELLKDVPVEWKAMGEVLKIKNGKDYKQFKSGKIPVYGSGGIMTHIDTHVFDKASVLIPRKGSLKNLFFVTEPFWTVDTIFWTDINRKIIEPKFIFYYLKTQNLEELNMAGGVPSLTQSVLNKLPLPIPHPNDPQKSLAIQQEIVRILDSLSEQNKALTTALANEIENRKKQYAYYREELFRFEGKEVEWKSLGEVAENLDALRKPVKSDSRDLGDIPYYGASGIVDYVKDYIFDGDFLLVSEDGANLIARSTPIAFSISGKSWVNNHAHILKFENKSQRKLVEYYLNSIDLEPYITGAAQPKLSQKNLNKINVPVIARVFELESLVHLLDQLDEATKSISSELEKEIELRNKQFEYYRNLLLTFPK